MPTTSSVLLHGTHGNKDDNWIWRKGHLKGAGVHIHHGADDIPLAMPKSCSISLLGTTELLAVINHGMSKTKAGSPYTYPCFHCYVKSLSINSLRRSVWLRTF